MFHLLLCFQAVGEPPLFLAASVFFAIQAAVSAACNEFGETYKYDMDSPATCERIRMACADHITKQVYNTTCHVYFIFTMVVTISTGCCYC